MATDESHSRLVWLLSPTDMADLKGLGDKRAAGKTLFREGDRVSEDDGSDYAVLILSGRVRVTAVGIDGREVLLAERDPPAIVGELSAIDRQRRSATVTVIEPGEAVVIGAKTLEDFLFQHRDAMRSLLMAIIGCLRAADRHQVEIRTRTAPYQLVRRLLELAEQQHSDTTDQDADIDLRISQEELGRQVGVARITVQRALNELCGNRVVEKGPPAHYIVRLRALRQYLSD